MYYNRTFLKFRFRQLGKIVQEIPIPYMLVLGIMILFLLYGLHHFMDSLGKVAMMGGCFLLLIYILHIKRSDYHFMQLVEEWPERICCVDYWLALALHLYAGRILLLCRAYGHALHTGITAGSLSASKTEIKCTAIRICNPSGMLGVYNYISGTLVVGCCFYCTGRSEYNADDCLEVCFVPA